jgi:hypothetical protein
VHESGPRVGVLTVFAPREEPRREEIHDEPPRGYGEHRPGVDLRRCAPAFDRFHDHPHRGNSERHPVAEGRQCFCAAIPVRSDQRARPAGHPLRRQGEREGARIGEHVPGVGDQGQAMGEPPRHGFDDHEADGQQKRREKPPLGSGAGVPPVVMMMAVRVRAWVMRVLRGHGQHPGGAWAPPGSLP